MTGLDPELLAALTPRQRDVARLLAEGDGVRTIARRLGLSPTTVRGHIDAIRRHLTTPAQEPPQ